MTKKPSKSKKIDLLPFWGREILEKSLSITVPFFRVLEIEILHWQFRFFKPRKKSVFVPNYRTHTRTLITTNCKKANNREFAIALFPFILTLFLLIRAQSKGQPSSYIVKDTLPGICISPQNISWETFREITLKKIVSLNNHEILRIQDFLKRFDVSSNLILLEMKPAWEQEQKQFYIGFLPKENQIDLNKLRIPSLFFDQKQKVAKNEIVHISNSPLQIKNTKNDNKENFSGYNFYARKQSFLRSYKDKINLKRRLIDKKPNLINLFLKQQFQQKLFDLDELPLKLDQNCSEVFSMRSQASHTSLKSLILKEASKTQEDPDYSRLLNSSITNTTRTSSSHTSGDSKANLQLEKSSLATYPLQRKGHISCASLNSSILTTRGSLIPNLFETLQLSGVTEKLNNKSDLLVFSSNKKRKIHNIENGIADQTKLLNISSEENVRGNVSEKSVLIFYI
jgi:hypothetical protein